MSTLAISPDFLLSFAKLQKPVQKAVHAAIDKFQHHTHAGLHLEPLKNAVDSRIRTIRIDRFWRGVVLAPPAGEIYCLLAVLPHDDAIAYATSRRFTVNQALGVLEVRDESALQQLTPALQAESAKSETRLFEQVKDTDLVRLGVDADVLPLVRLLTSEVQLAALSKLIPEPQHDALVGLASGLTPEEVWTEISELATAVVPSTGVDADDILGAMERTPSKVAFVSGPAELADMLAHPFDLWRLFLHPAQHAIAYRPTYAGPAQVTGGAGTGKTVTALHRAYHLARAAADGQPILLTTFTSNLAQNLAAQLDRLIDDAAVRQRVEVVHVDRLANQLLTRLTQQRLAIAQEPELNELWSAASKATGGRFSPTFLASEWDEVVLAQNIRTAGDYLGCSRFGRGAPLTTSQRSQVWQALRDVTSALLKQGRWTYRQIADQAAEWLATTTDKPYRNVIVDEAQDLHPTHWRMLRALVPPGPNDLFLVGDPHQRIYGSRVSLRQLGIEVRGRSRKLRLSYRITEETLRWSVPLLGKKPIVGMDDNIDTLEGFHASLHGPRPVVQACSDRTDELGKLVAQLQTWLSNDIEPSDIGIAARSNAQVAEAEEALRRAGIMTAKLGTARPTGRAVRLGTMHKMKGLEFRFVAIVGADARHLPAPAALTPEADDAVAHAQDLQRERCLLFVACTRARDSLYISYTGRPSPFLHEH